MRGNASKFASKQETQKAAEMRLFIDLMNAQPQKRALYTVEFIERNYHVSHAVAVDRLAQAKQRWTAE